MMNLLSKIITMLGAYVEIIEQSKTELMSLNEEFLKHRGNAKEMVRIHFEGLTPTTMKIMFINERINQLLWVLDQLINEMPHSDDPSLIRLISDMKEKRSDLLRGAQDTTNTYLEVQAAFKEIILIRMGEAHGY